MKRLMILLMLGLFQVGLFAGLAGATASSFLDDFNSFDTNLWSKGSHNLGRSYLDPNNVSVSNGNLNIKLPARKLNGGEIVSNDLYGYGSYTTRMKIPNAPSSITGFFLYQPPDYASEIDIELYNDSSRKIMFTTYGDASLQGPTHTTTMTLPFDPTAGFHEYRMDYAPNSISFYVDNQLLQQWTDGLPQNSMHLYVNAWYPTWLAGTKPHKDSFVQADRVQYTAQ